MGAILNSELCFVNSCLDNARLISGTITHMGESLADRLREVFGRDKASHVSAKLAKHGISVSYQAIHKWLKGGNVSDENLQAVAEIYGVSAAWLKYGTGARAPARNELAHVGEVIEALDAESRRVAVEHLHFLLTRQAMPPETMGRYLAMIDRIKRDMDDKR